MRIGELAKRARVSRDAIRFYERNGLIASQPSDSATNNYRIYPADTIPTLELIQEAQAAGLTLADLRAFIAALQNACTQDFDADAFLDAKIEEVEERIRQSKRFLRALKQTKAAIAISA